MAECISNCHAMSSTRVADDRRKAASVVVSVLATLVLMSVMLAAIGRKMSAVASMVAATLVAVVGAMVMSSADERCDDKGGRRDGGRLAEVAMRGDNNDDDVSFLGDSDDDAFGGDELDGHPMGSAFDADSDDETPKKSSSGGKKSPKAKESPRAKEEKPASKRGPSGYNLFVKNQGVAITEAAKQWKGLSDSAREKWNAKAKAAK